MHGDSGHPDQGMRISKKLLEKSKKEALKEIEKFGSPTKDLFEISSAQTKRLSEKYGADPDISLLGSYLADFKLGEAISKGRIKDHVKMSSEAAGKLLEKEGLKGKQIGEVVHCVEAHHGTIPYKSLEAEVVANADCYRFLTPRGVFSFTRSLAMREDMALDDIVDYVEEKADEKWSILSLPGVRKDLEASYKSIKKWVADARTV